MEHSSGKQSKFTFFSAEMCIRDRGMIGQNLYSFHVRKRFSKSSERLQILDKIAPLRHQHMPDPDWLSDLGKIAGKLQDIVVFPARQLSLIHI